MQYLPYVPAAWIRVVTIPLAVSATIASGPTSAAGQRSQATADSLPSTGQVCFKGQPPPACASFFVFELRAQMPVAQTRRSVSYGTAPSDPQSEAVNAFGRSLGWEIGHAWNLGDRYAAGPTVGIELGGPDTRAYLRGRVRRWASAGDSISLEVASGLSVATGSYQNNGVGGTLDARVNFDDKLALIVRYDVVRANGSSSTSFMDPGGIQHVVSLGGNLGTTHAIWGTGILAVGFLGFVLLYSLAVSE